jgi:hypothetical protein
MIFSPLNLDWHSLLAVSTFTPRPTGMQTKMSPDAWYSRKCNCPNVTPIRRAFYCFQYWPMVLVASSIHSRSDSSAMSSTALKNLTGFGFGLANGRSLPAPTRTATSSGVQFSRFATCAASSRAGKPFAAQVVIAVCIRWSVPAGSHLRESLKRRNTSAFYQSDHSGLSLELRIRPDSVHRGSKCSRMVYPG